VLLAPGTLIADRYVVERKIGEGSWGEVWAGRHARVGMKVAIKVLLDAKAASYDAIARFKREAMFLGKVHSDHVARVLDFIDDEIFGLVLVMEFVEGESLAEVLRRGPLSVEDAIDLACDLVTGLSDLHAARIVHRDMKPANVILRPLPAGPSRAVIIDFTLGRILARPGEAEPSITQLTGSQMVVGTVPYMAPEQILDSRKVTEATDVYAVGAMLFRSVSGRHVFEGRDEATVARRKLTVEAPHLDTGRDDALGEEFERVVGRALRRRPEDRYSSARAMLDELIALRSSIKERAATPRRTDPAPPPGDGQLAPEITLEMSRPSDPGMKRRRKPVVLFSLGGVCVLAVGVVLGVGVAHVREKRVAPSASAEPRAVASLVTSSPPPAATSAAPAVVNLDDGDASASYASDTNAARATLAASPITSVPKAFAMARPLLGLADAGAPLDASGPGRNYAPDAASVTPARAPAVGP
jgi:serine/threonine-protein kinase